MPRTAPQSISAAPVVVWTALCLPLLLVVAACFLFIGDEAAVAAHFAQWRLAHPDALKLVKLYTDWGNPAMYLVFAAMLGLGLKRGRADLVAWALAYLAAQLLFSLAIERVLKIGIGRPRPGVGGECIPWSLDGAHNSMPSGHTTEMSVQTGTLALFARALLVPVLMGLLLAAMGASRLFVGAHHPSDLLGGLVLGGLGGLFASRLAPWLTPRLATFLAQRFALFGGR
ncbi:MAG TPA: phosphatase PAP2 family protein [Humidesulfovibrio sp.]|uniref:phosphatase PAP2 family protein n=1 Tax=Humidesulfovibrio sp. TaxID=2910988 RepID=UPI002CF1C13A|nr:phosphatase PAP2 family protein [Humidesulfovibrio sp.]HWR03301.1 phosphatase PAP2 family protein [Humidesulfovibrio sp.]